MPQVNTLQVKQPDVPTLPDQPEQKFGHDVPEVPTLKHENQEIPKIEEPKKPKINPLNLPDPTIPVRPNDSRQHTPRGSRDFMINKKGIYLPLSSNDESFHAPMTKELETKKNTAFKIRRLVNNSRNPSNAGGRSFYKY